MSCFSSLARWSWFHLDASSHITHPTLAVDGSTWLSEQNSSTSSHHSHRSSVIHRSMDLVAGEIQQLLGVGHCHVSACFLSRQTYRESGLPGTEYGQATSGREIERFPAPTSAISMDLFFLRHTILVHIDPAKYGKWTLHRAQGTHKPVSRKQERPTQDWPNFFDQIWLLRHHPCGRAWCTWPQPCATQESGRHLPHTPSVHLLSNRKIPNGRRTMDNHSNIRLAVGQLWRVALARQSHLVCPWVNFFAAFPLFSEKSTNTMCTDDPFLDQSVTTKCTLLHTWASPRFSDPSKLPSSCHAFMLSWNLLPSPTLHLCVAQPKMIDPPHLFWTSLMLAPMSHDNKSSNLSSNLNDGCMHIPVSLASFLLETPSSELHNTGRCSVGCQSSSFTRKQTNLLSFFDLPIW